MGPGTDNLQDTHTYTTDVVGLCRLAGRCLVRSIALVHFRTGHDLLALSRTLRPRALGGSGYFTPLL